MVYQPPYPWYIDPPTHGILTPLLMVYQTLSYGIMNSSLSFGRNEGGGVQYTMTKNLPRGQNTIWKIEPGVIWYFEPHGKLNPGSIYIHGILNPLIEN
jgi:hypothetical protein